MSEFNNRMAAQRKVLLIVNQKEWPGEPLYGLSRKAISRWTSANQIDTKSNLWALIIAVSSKLSFLAAKSQEHVTETYSDTANEVNNLADTIAVEIKKNWFS